jgi:quercetin dioxygenase-like cupin family protein
MAETAYREGVGYSAGEAAEEVIKSSNVRVETVRLADDAEIAWQRCPVSDRVFVVTEGRGHVYRAHGRDEIRDEISTGDVVYLKRLVWHRIVHTADEKLTGALITCPPLEVEYRR